MADNIITILNFTENNQHVALTDSNNNTVASGYIGPGQTSGFTVPNPGELYNVYFLPQGASGYLSASGVLPNSQVGVSITSGD
jgi:hypothetical protein